MSKAILVMDNMPEKIPEFKSGYEDLGTSIRRVGWNACFDEILEERKE